MHLVAARQKKLRQVAAVLARHTKNQSLPHPLAIEDSGFLFTRA
jgi:hypothetical protein